MTRTEIKAVALRMDPHRTKHTQPSARQVASFDFRVALLSLSYCICTENFMRMGTDQWNACEAPTIFKPTADPNVRRAYGPPDIGRRACNGIRLSADERPRCDRRCCSRHRHRGDSRGISEDNSLQEVPSVSFAHENRTFTITVNLKDGIVEHSATSSHTAPR